ncbi:MAG: UvrD-helicase domain-containing protein, partial [Eubacterium sp.]|nr:UvrD-helicase domain-containing protein [Eubacterium sp.]
MPDWNKSQQKVLDSLEDECNVLVSAAAGSGKTAVLVERIIRTVHQGLADIDEILVCTFTRAAAAQMKTKIIKQFEKLASLDEDSDNRFARQLTLAQSADIMTIDSFCNKVVRENFSIAGMDPAFEIYDSDEVALLKEDILDEVLDHHYRDDEAFCRLAGFMMNRSIDD